ncbi:type I methionyl aminopeptidase [Candidatus Dojkabacteria bacterium]|uniref:Methionine aminopeptidase n=1 Tax=Candidatus Dojkabacteria bacterium TaxID=2099670 RepID=A0A955KZK7_9BACT|nr:type I methionyl aminopeptidase [Candidatus Dojkabacteria bacterium]
MKARRTRASDDFQISKVRAAAAVSTEILQQLVAAVEIGTTPRVIAKLADKLCQQQGVIPAFRGVAGARSKFSAPMCISVNDAVLHGLPTDEAIQDGDLVKLDFGIIKDGYYTDHCVTVGVGNVSAADLSLLKIGRLAVMTAASAAVSGKHTGDLGHTMQTIAETAGYQVLTDYVGHGIGRSLWQAPQIPAYGVPGSGELLEPGMVICVEAQVVAGSNEVFVDNDGWTVRTADGSRGVMFEYMVLVGSGKPEILTKTMDLPLVVSK